MSASKWESHHWAYTSASEWKAAWRVFIIVSVSPMMTALAFVLMMAVVVGFRCGVELRQ